jgi:hypothetical protein
MEVRSPEVGDRVAIPRHAVIFMVRGVNKTKKTADAEPTLEGERIEEGIPWKMITFIGP